MNKIDKVGADFAMCVESIKTRLSPKAVAVQFPYGQASDFQGIVDLVTMKYYTFEGASGEQQIEHDIPADAMDKANTMRETLIDTVSVFDDALAEAFLGGEEVSKEMLVKAIRAGVVSNQCYPVLVGTALKNAGVQLLLDAAVAYLPSPTDVGAMRGVDVDDETKVLTRDSSDDAPVSALAFKIMTDPFVGTLTFVRVYSGVVKSGDQLLNPITGERERVGRLLLMHSNKREEISEIHAGHICAFLGLKDTRTGHTLCDPKNPIILEKMDFPDPVIALAVEPESKKDQEKLGIALGKLAYEDPSFQYYSDEESGQTIISGMGELHLEIIVDRLKREHKVSVQTGKPQVAYRETITKSGEGEGKFVRQSGGRGQYGHVLLRLEPITEGDDNYQFESEIKGGVIPNEFIPAIDKGAKETMQQGILAGYPLIKIKAVPYFGSYHDVDSSEVAFKIATFRAFKDAFTKAGGVILEPIMDIEVTTPEDYVGDVMGNLSSRRGMIQGQEQRGTATIIRAKVPLAEMFGYSTDLRSFTQGRASFDMQFSSYEKVPDAISQQIIKERIAAGKVRAMDDE